MFERSKGHAQTLSGLGKQRTEKSRKNIERRRGVLSIYCFFLPSTSECYRNTYHAGNTDNPDPVNAKESYKPHSPRGRKHACSGKRKNKMLVIAPIYANCLVGSNKPVRTTKQVRSDEENGDAKNLNSPFVSLSVCGAPNTQLSNLTHIQTRTTLRRSCHSLTMASTNHMDGSSRLGLHPLSHSHRKTAFSQ